MTLAVSGDSITYNDLSVQNTAAKVGMVNRIINGDMRIDQRNAGASVTPADGQYLVDRYQASLNVVSKFSIQRSTTVPAGFINSLLATSLSAYSIGAGEVTGVVQKIEGFNVADLGWGGTGAQPATLSFWVRSSLTGAFGGSFRNSAGNRSYPFSYTISAANTWEQKTVTITGDTSGTWLTDNGVGVQLYFSLGAGSTFSGTAGAWAAANFVSATGAVSVVGTSGATFYITGVQLEKGSTATSFDYRDYGRELIMCQRYALVYGGSSVFEPLSVGVVQSTTSGLFVFSFPVQMRSAPTLGVSSLSAFVINDAGVQNATSNMAQLEAGTKTALVLATSTGLTTGRAARLIVNNSLTASLSFFSEL